MREIISLKPLIHNETRLTIIFTSPLYVRQGKELPEEGESVVVISKQCGARFQGRVTTVNKKDRTYIAEFYQ